MYFLASSGLDNLVQYLVRRTIKIANEAAAPKGGFKMEVPYGEVRANVKRTAASKEASMRCLAAN